MAAVNGSELFIQLRRVLVNWPPAVDYAGGRRPRPRLIEWWTTAASATRFGTPAWRTHAGDGWSWCARDTQPPGHSTVRQSPGRHQQRYRPLGPGQALPAAGRCLVPPPALRVYQPALASRSL